MARTSAYQFGFWQILLVAFFFGMNTSVSALAVCDCGPYGQMVSDGVSPPSCIDYATTYPFVCNGVNPKHPAMPVPSGTASPFTTAITSSVTTATQSITSIADEAPKTQAGAVNAAGDVALTGANNKANAGALFCANGANNELDAPGSGGEDIALCQNSFKDADQLAKMAAANGKDATLTRDEALLNDEAALGALEKFQRNFGVDKDEYVRRMLASHGSPSEFSDMLSSKFSADKLNKLLTTAAEAQPVEETAAVAQPAESEKSGGSRPKPSTSLRDSLKAKLDAAEANRKLASAKPAKTDYGPIKTPGEKLQPAGLSHWINGSDDQQEESLTIFDVVHQKLQSLKQRERI